MSEPVGRRADQRRERRRAQVRRTAVLLGILIVVAVAFAIWLAFDAPEPPGTTAGGNASAAAAGTPVRPGS